MVEEKLEPEVEEVMGIIKAGKNFLLSGGAGSGKTYSLVQIIRQVIKYDATSEIVCITYTNAAVKEIQQRISCKNLKVSTIHDFLWDTISSYQKELKESLLKIINDPNSKIKNPNGNGEYSNEFGDGIKYKEYLRIDKGEISHDEVLILANYMYKNYAKLCDIINDKYQYIFVDEYQDTSPLVVEILLEYLQKGKRKSVIGLFGDLMQAIYDGGAGDIEKYINAEVVKEVRKTQNRRNPKKVMDLANNLRMDGLAQEPSNDVNAPNMENGIIKQGDIKFIYSAVFDWDKLSKCKYVKHWIGLDSSETKELRLTHKLISNNAGFSELMEIYDSDPIMKFKKEIVDEIRKNQLEINDQDTFEKIIEQVNLTVKIKENKGRSKKEVYLEDETFSKSYNKVKDWPFSKVKKIYLNKDNLIDDKQDSSMEDGQQKAKRDRIIQHLFGIQGLIQLYSEGQYNDFLRRTPYKINSIQDKTEIKKMIDELVGMGESTIEEVVNYADKNGLYKIDDKFETYIETNDYLYDRVKKVKFKCFQHLYKYLEGYVPLSTQHKIKGNEFNNVLVILDNGGWNSYNFEYLFNTDIKSSLKGAKVSTFDNILKRTKKLFYVCCTRAKENLVVYYPNPTEHVLKSATDYFGADNLVDLEKEEV